MIETPITDILTHGGTTIEETYKKEVLKDFWICCVSREASILGRKEVLTGKAKFGIVGDGKEVPQVAMARAFRKGDWRSGYYRDQTLMFALGLSTVEDFFAQLYADSENDPFSKGRQMNSHFATPLIDDNNEWLDHTQRYNISADISSTAAQMARALGISYASKKYRELPHLAEKSLFSKNGSEVTFCTIGDASTSEGIFWETLNAASVLQVPLVVSVWDDGYGISVPTIYQTAKGSISDAVAGLLWEEGRGGMEIHKVKCWNYPALCELYEEVTQRVRNTHRPVLIHVEDCTQQLGHSTSGSHERYKSKERLQWEKDNDCIVIMGNWMVETGIATESEISELRERAKLYVKECKERAWDNFISPVRKEKQQLQNIYAKALQTTTQKEEVSRLLNELENTPQPQLLNDVIRNARRLHFILRSEENNALEDLENLLTKAAATAHRRYHTYLYSESKYSALKVPVIRPVYSEKSEIKNGYEVLNSFFDKAFEKYPNLLAFGEDVGKIGGVNQSFAGLQAKYGEERIFDTGIREWSIVGQAIGLAMRGFRPIAEIQYLDYLIYGLEPLTDDLATLRYRSHNLQQAPVIIRTRGHRLEGIWHSGSPIQMLLGSLRGIYLLVPRNFVQAAGMYNTMLHSDDPALIIECLNGYRLKERMPDNIGEYTVPLGVPEVLAEGTDVTLVTYGSCVRVAQEGIELLKKAGISVELIDVQTLLPFDLEHRIVASLKKTNRILFLDEDVPGGATSYMMQEVLEVQGGYQYLDSPPVTLTAKPHRPPYGSDGDYFSKPNAEDVYEAIYRMVHEGDQGRFF